MARLGWPVLVGLAWTVLLFLMLPTLVAIPVSLTPEVYLSLPKGGLSLQHWAKLLGDPSWRGSIGQSLAIESVVTVLATTIGTLAAIGLWRLSSWLAESVRLLALAPMIVPPIVSALAFYKAWSGLGILDTFTGVITAHTLLAIPYVLITVSAALATIDLRQEQASRSLGATLPRKMWDGINERVDPTIAAAATVLFLVTLLAIGWQVIRQARRGAEAPA